MIRKEIPEQNDISIIIGNLPKRLQRKFAEEIDSEQEQQRDVKYVEATNNATKNVDEGTLKSYYSKFSNGVIQKRETDNHIDAESISPVLEIGGKINANQFNVDEVAIPGILRLKNKDITALTNNDTSNRNDFNKKSRVNQHTRTTQQKSLHIKVEQTSPLHQHISLTSTPSWFKEFENPIQAAKLYDTMVDYLKRKNIVQDWNNFCTVHSELQKLFMHLMLTQLKLCCEEKVDVFFWKLLFYNVRENLKRHKSSEAFNYNIALLDKGLKFYTTLYHELSKKYINNNESQRVIKLETVVKVKAQKILIWLGDLSRYKAKQMKSNDYDDATRFYERAQKLIPSNGIPYNQLAIVALHCNNKFEAIYFHMRSLMSSNAIYSAKESLLFIFDDIRVKYEDHELKNSPIHKIQKNQKTAKPMRKEVWIHSDGVRQLHRSNFNGCKLSYNGVNRFNNIPPDELYNQFIELYLYIIGKLYMGICIESIYEYQRKLLLQLKTLLESTTIYLSRSKLQKIIALNIFIIEYNKGNERRREVRYHAFNFANQIFGIILKKCNALFSELNGGTYNINDSCFIHLNTFLQCFRIYSDWLTFNLPIWEPVRNNDHIFLDCWDELERVFEFIKQSLIKTEQITQIEGEVFLEEDIFLDGFTPLIRAITNQNILSTSSEFLQFVARLKKVENFQKVFIANRENLKNVETSNFIMESLNSSAIDALNSLEIGYDGNCDNNENSINPTNFMEIEKSLLNINSDEAQISQLTKLKKELEEKTHMKKMVDDKLEQIFKHVDTIVYMEVRPKYLMPDTNCFIDYFEDLEKIAEESKFYTLVIPFTVVRELDGLSKGVKVDSYRNSINKQRIHHFDEVSSRAKKSLNFIKTGKSNIKCATMKGSFINASLFALVEEENLSNDDKILATALKVSKNCCKETVKDGKCLIQTELVLTTSDRNLRVKALARNLAVSELSEFLQWANNCEFSIKK